MSVSSNITQEQKFLCTKTYHGNLETTILHETTFILQYKLSYKENEHFCNTKLTHKEHSNPMNANNIAGNTKVTVQRTHIHIDIRMLVLTLALGGGSGVTPGCIRKAC